MQIKHLYTLVTIAFLCIACSGDDNSRFLEGTVNPEIDSEYFEDGDYEVLFESSKENPITIVFMGDAYTRDNLGKNIGNYRKDAIKNFDFIFNAEPFKTYKAYFNAVIVYTESDSFEIPRPGFTTNSYRALSTVIRKKTNGRLVYRSNLFQVDEYLDALPDAFTDNMTLLIGVNYPERLGNATFSSDVGHSSSMYTEVMLHELGHSFADISDEYEGVGSSTANALEGPNLDTTDDLELIKWSHFINLNGYDTVKAFEGGGYTSSNVFRPEENSIMRSAATGLSRFNAPSREAIVKTILARTGETYSFETFLEKDSFDFFEIQSHNRNSNTTIHSCTD